MALSHSGTDCAWSADASTLRFGLRASDVKRAALADQIGFGLFRPGSELMLAVSLHSVHECERQMLFCSSIYFALAVATCCCLTGAIPAASWLRS